VAVPPAPVTEILGGDLQEYQISGSGPVFDCQHVIVAADSVVICAAGGVPRSPTRE
jgi:hypothetical protein